MTGDGGKPARPSEAVARWRIHFLVASAAVALVPLYGFFATTWHDSQGLALAILVAWAITGMAAIAAVALAWARPPPDPGVKRAALLLTFLLVVASVVGLRAVWGAAYVLIVG